MKFGFTHIICIKHGETDDLIHQAKIPLNKEVYPHGNGRARIEEVEIEHELQHFLRKVDLVESFCDWYYDNVDTSVQQVFYPSYKLRVSYQLWEFLKLYKGQYTVLMFDDEVEISMKLEA